MKVLKKNLMGFALCFVAMFCAFVLLQGVQFPKVYATPVGGSVAVSITVDGVTKTSVDEPGNVVSVPYPNTTEGVEYKISLWNNNAEYASTSGQVVYSFLKEGSGSFIFSQLGDPVEFSAANPLGEMRYNFFTNGGVGTYRIKAVLMTATGLIANADIQELKFKIEMPNSTQWLSRIVQSKIGTNELDFPEYSCTASVKSFGETVDLSNYTIDWYYQVNNQEKIFYGSGETIVWSPRAVGTYMLYAQIEELNISIQENFGEVSKNFSTYAIIGFCVLGAGLTTLVIITTVRKINKERVW